MITGVLQPDTQALRRATRPRKRSSFERLPCETLLGHTPGTDESQTQNRVAVGYLPGVAIKGREILQPIAHTTPPATSVSARL